MRFLVLAHLASMTARLTILAVRTTDTSVSSLLIAFASIGALSGSAFESPLADKYSLHAVSHASERYVLHMHSIQVSKSGKLLPYAPSWAC